MITKLLITPDGGGVVGGEGMGSIGGSTSFEQEVHITTTISTNVPNILKNVQIDLLFCFITRGADSPYTYLIYVQIHQELNLLQYGQDMNFKMNVEADIRLK